MTIEEYSALLDSVFKDLAIFKQERWPDREIDGLNELLVQLRFIDDVVKSGASFKQALIKQRSRQWRGLLEKNPPDDTVLKDAILAIYNDLESHDYNVGDLTLEQSKNFYNIISDKSLYYDKDKDENGRMTNNRVISKLFSYEINGLNSYRSLWIDNGHKNIQFFMLTNKFSYCDIADQLIEDIPSSFEQISEETFEKKLASDIWRVEQFYMTEQASGTNMYLNPIETRTERRLDQPWRIHFYDLHGNLIEKSTAL